MTPEEVRKYVKLHLSNTYGMMITKEQKEKILEIYKEGRHGLYKDTDSVKEKSLCMYDLFDTHL